MLLYVVWWILAFMIGRLSYSVQFKITLRDNEIPDNVVTDSHSYPKNWKPVLVLGGTNSGREIRTENRFWS